MTRFGHGRVSSLHLLRRVIAAAAVIAVLLPGSLPGAACASIKHVLFDNTHGETAGNADWIIDTYQPLPLPDQSTVTAATPRTYWLGGISSWGIDLVKRGFTVATLTTAYGITYGNGGNPYDLSNFDVFIVPEPNTVFTAAESTALFHYVAEGGGLIAVSDHIGSDRNGDGWDSPLIWNRLDQLHLWGASFETTGLSSNFVEVYSTNVNASLADSVIHGPSGQVGGLEYHNGTCLDLDPGANASVAGSVWRNGSPQGLTDVMCARSVYGNGRIVFVGDSSPIDDGSAQPGNSSIFDGWGEAAGNDSLLFLNATAWVARRDAPLVGVTPDPAPPAFERPPFPNPARGAVQMTLVLPHEASLRAGVYDLGGRVVRTLADERAPAGARELVWNGEDARGAPAPTGLYFVRVEAGDARHTWRVMWIR
jgi:hypothetical protein